MNCYMFAEHDDLDEMVAALQADIAAWCEPKTSIEFIYRSEDGESAPKSPRRRIELGIEYSLKKESKLKDPLNSLYKIAQKHKCEFVVGSIEDGEYRDVCYFGHEEGRPDMYEIANYLELD